MVLPAPTNVQYEVQNLDATQPEYYVAVSLDRLKLPYLFQFEVIGGRTRRGGLILDFLVLTDPLSTPVFVNGEYWHSGEQASEDRLAQAIIRQFSNFAEPVVFWGNQLQTLEDAYSAVKAAFRM